MRKIKAVPHTRWRRQELHKLPENKCSYCGKLYFLCEEDAYDKADELTRVLNRPHYVYEHHGHIHLTTQPQQNG